MYAQKPAPVPEAASWAVDNRLREAAMACVTPAQMARLFRQPEAHVARLLDERLGIQVSRGAARGSTYRKRDLEVFDAAARERLYELIVTEAGGVDQLARAAGQGDWYETVAGQLAETVLNVFGGSAEHVSSKRKPIRKRDFVLSICGMIFATVPVLLLFPLTVASWYSWERWRQARAEKPTISIVVGWIVATAYALLVAWVMINLVAQLLLGHPLT